jgi:hypothetical protein
MQTTQLTCPHCASTLNFGAAISAGTPVECLICMRAFTAVNPVTTAAVAPPPKPAPMPVIPGVAKIQPPSSPEVMVAKPHTAPTSVMAAKSVPIGAPAMPSAEPAPRPSVRQRADGPNVALIAGSVAVLLLLTGGIGVALWKVAAPAPESATGNNAPKETPQIVQVESLKEVKQPEDGGGTALNINPDDEQAIKKGFQEEMKQILKRKPRTKDDGDDPDWNLGTMPLAKNTVAGLDQPMINDAIKKGVASLKRSQQPNGTWNFGHPTGHAALGGLTLLECGEPADNKVVQKAAGFVRSQCAGLRSTYEISLAVLFLDRLREPRDQPLIQGLALRLMAGQNEAGGWSYMCDALSPQDMFQLFTFLKSNEQLLNPTGAMPKAFALDPVRDSKLALNDPFRQFNDLMLKQAVRVEKKKDDSKRDAKDEPKTDAKEDPTETAKTNPKGGAKNPPALMRADALNPNVKRLPVVQHKGNRKGNIGMGFGGGDNSNSQFAMLALWAARRHGVPTTQALMLANQRFTISQNADNGWGYHMQLGSKDTMTCVGLLGLGIGHGAAPEIVNGDPKNPKPALEDPRIQKGLQALAFNIGQPSPDAKKKNFSPENLYFLWSVERVAMLYDLKTIGGKDWYGWGAQVLVHTQNGDGAWLQSSYPGCNPTVNTCFALLFLKRSNLVADLTNHLRLNVGVRESP